MANDLGDPFRTVLGIAVLACAGFQAASCGGDALPDGEASGVVHVRNAPEGEWGEEGGWDFEEIWRFDTWADSQPEHFGGAPLSVSIAPNGRRTPSGSLDPTGIGSRTAPMLVTR